MAAPAWPWARGLTALAVLALLLAAPTFYNPHWPAAPAPASPTAETRPEPPEPTHPPPGHLPAGLWTVAQQVRHVIAVDASRSRLYLLERGATSQWQLAAEHPVSLGRAGIDKHREGDARTPLGLYHITSRLEGPGLDPFYGPGALTLDYPNPLDRTEGRTGSRIWIHGSPTGRLRPPRDTDGCVVLANEALQDLLARVAIRRTPVLIAPRIEWLAPAALAAERAAFEQAWSDWKTARRRAGGPAMDYKDLSLLAWPDGRPVVQATFGEVPRGQRAGVTRRQHWRLEQGQWRLFDERLVQ